MDRMVKEAFQPLDPDGPRFILFASLGQGYNGGDSRRKGSMDANIKRMKKFLLAACAAGGVADEASLHYDPTASAFTIGDSRVCVVVADRVWEVVHYYDVVDLANGGMRQIRDRVASFGLDMEAMAAKAAVMRVLEFHLDAAIDEAS